MAVCSLLVSLTGVTDAETVCAARRACEACCRHPEPSAESLTPVVASLLYRAAIGILRNGGVSTCSIAKAESLRTVAIEAIESVEWTPLYKHEELIDRSITAATLTDLFLSRRAFAYLRYGDGEWMSILGSTGVNGDGHDFFPETLGRELRQVLEEIADRRDDGSPVFVGTTHLLQEAIQPFVVANDLKNRVPWVSDAILRIGLADLSTRQFIEAVAAYDGPKFLVASRRLRPVARALGCWHIVIPLRNCYEHLGWIEAATRFDGAGIVLSCASMMSECLLWRLFRRNPQGTYVDCGSIFDWMLGCFNRHEAFHYREILKREYFPLFQKYLDS